MVGRKMSGKKCYDGKKIIGDLDESPKYFEYRYRRGRKARTGNPTKPRGLFYADTTTKSEVFRGGNINLKTKDSVYFERTT